MTFTRPTSGAQYCTEESRAGLWKCISSRRPDVGYQITASGNVRSCHACQALSVYGVQRVSMERFDFWHSARADKEASGSGASNLQLRRCSSHLFTPNLTLYRNPSGLQGGESRIISRTRRVMLSWAVYCVHFGNWSPGDMAGGSMWTLERFCALRPFMWYFKKSENRLEVCHQLQSILVWWWNYLRLPRQVNDYVNKPIIPSHEVVLKQYQSVVVNISGTCPATSWPWAHHTRDDIQCDSASSQFSNTSLCRLYFLCRNPYHLLEFILAIPHPLGFLSVLFFPLCRKKVFEREAPIHSLQHYCVTSSFV